MTANQQIVELLHDVLAPLGHVTARRMFGGIGVYLDGLFFALLFDGTAYFKVSEDTRAAYEAEGMGPFTYETDHGEHALKSYWRLPERLYDEPDEMIVWARAALQVARQAQAAKPKSKQASKQGAKTGAKSKPEPKSKTRPSQKTTARKPPGRATRSKPKK